MKYYKSDATGYIGLLNFDISNGWTVNNEFTSRNIVFDELLILSKTFYHQHIGQNVSLSGRIFSFSSRGAIYKHASGVKM